MDKKTAFSIPISNGILTPEHVKRIGTALWYFVWCIDHITEEIINEKGERFGRVHRGGAIYDKDVASALGFHINTVQAMRVKLTNEGYIQTTRTPHGHTILVVKSKKWNHKKPRKVKKSSTGNCGSQIGSEPQEIVDDSSPEPQNPGSDTQKSNREPQETVDRRDLAVDFADDRTKNIKQLPSPSGSGNVSFLKPTAADKAKTDEFILALKTMVSSMTDGRAKMYNGVIQSIKRTAANLFASGATSESLLSAVRERVQQSLDSNNADFEVKTVMSDIAGSLDVLLAIANEKRIKAQDQQEEAQHAQAVIEASTKTGRAVFEARHAQIVEENAIAIPADAEVQF